MANRFLRRPEVLRITGLSDPTLKRHEEAGTFPGRYQLGENSVGWAEDEILAWAATRKRVTKPTRSNHQDNPETETAS
jgi:predicted DNA-binding transcriptional regulator AlpA